MRKLDARTVIDRSSSVVVAPVAPSLDAVRVIGVHRSGDGEPPSGAAVEAGLGDIIVIRVHDLQSLANVAKCLSTDDRTLLNCHEQRIALFLDGREIKGLAPESGAPRPESETLQFHLQRSAESDEAWADLLGAPKLEGDAFFRRPTELSVGLSNGYPVPTDVKSEQFRLVRIRRTWFVVCSILLVVVFILFIWMARASNLLRDEGPSPPAPRRKPYSLARFQMAFWFFLVVDAFLYIWLTTGGWNTITPTVLGLIGIGAGTALGAAVIDSNKSNTSDTTLASLRAEEPTLAGDVDALDARIAAATTEARPSLEQTRGAKQTRLQLVRDQIAALAAARQPQTSQSFLDDILTDGANGYSFHRFQMFVWTLVLGTLFVYSVWGRLSMPDFGATLLALLGLSGGTYLGFKIPEKQT